MTKKTAIKRKTFDPTQHVDLVNYRKLSLKPIAGLLGVKIPLAWTFNSLPILFDTKNHNKMKTIPAYSTLINSI